MGDPLSGIRLREIADGLVEICPDGKIADPQFFGKQTAEHRRPGIFALHDMVVVPGDHDAAVSARLFLLQDPQRILCHHPVALCVQRAGIVNIFPKLDILEQNVRRMDRLCILRQQLLFDCGDNLCTLLGGIAVRIIACFAVPYLLKFG